PRLQQVVTNLLDNGIKFTPAGGSVNVHVEVGPTGAQVVVRDTGQGITPQFLPNVFERFRQADGSTTRRHAGLGLGLGIAKQIVDMHGGTLSAQSDGANRGAVFRVVLPSIPEDAVTEAAGAEDTPPGALADLRVLVVDDNADARELLRRLLTEHGCNVDTASCAEEARMRAAAHRYDLLLTDIGMPGTDGYTLLEQL